MERAIQAAKRLKIGLAYHDYFGAKSDESGIYIVTMGGNTLYELPYGEGDQSNIFRLGDLRDLLSHFTEQGLI